MDCGEGALQPVSGVAWDERKRRPCPGVRTCAHVACRRAVRGGLGAGAWCAAAACTLVGVDAHNLRGMGGSFLPETGLHAALAPGCIARGGVVVLRCALAGASCGPFQGGPCGAACGRGRRVGGARGGGDLGEGTPGAGVGRGAFGDGGRQGGSCTGRVIAHAAQGQHHRGRGARRPVAVGVAR